ncbi:MULTISPECIES: GntR family transcriptional regulator [Rhodomicrobium]|uniref:GntR family transcriptional regulator n=1 Tax=Rhodomicrobium TaxID=1068 RepID=UPI001483693E|nr:MULTISPECIES: GntR family transcriptional regulator [Rhodomicrobium]
MKVRTTDIAQMASASDVIFDALREAINKGDLTEGQVLRQDQIAKMFNVSRIPVREALMRLEEQGLVSTQRYRGAVVTTLSTDEIREIFEFRAVLEPEVLRYSVERMSEEALANAKRFADAFATETDSSHWGELNRRFHYSLYEPAERPYYLQTIKAALDRVDRYLRAQLVLTDGMARAEREHQGILQACIDRDPERAAQLTRDHILGASASLIAFIERTRAEHKAASERR